jgi:hypothetical protein
MVRCFFRQNELKGGLHCEAVEHGVWYMNDGYESFIGLIQC